VKVTQVGGGAKVDITGRVVIATIQTLAKWTWVERSAFGERFGLVILDEAHHVPAATFAQIFGALPGRYRCGLTATPVRYDGLTDMLHWTCGPIVHAITQQELERRGFVLRPDVWQVHTGWVPESTTGEPHERAEELATSDRRNALLLRIVTELRSRGRRTLVLVDRTAHADQLAVRCGGVSLHAAVKDRTEIVARLASGDVDVVFATSLADEALDAPPIDAVVLGTPEANLGTVQQRIGRGCRPASGKRTPLAVDLVDGWGPWIRAAQSRRRHYKQLGWTVQDWRP
jgi:superfamily II DNA or RNA helicase